MKVKESDTGDEIPMFSGYKKSRRILPGARHGNKLYFSGLDHRRRSAEKGT